MGSRQLGRFVAPVLVLTLLAASCSSDEQGAGTKGTTVSTARAEPEEDINQPVFAGEPEVGGSITVGVRYQVERLSPAGSLGDSATLAPALAVYDPLISRDAKGALVPSLATEWSASDDLTTYTLSLREGVVFHDGTVFDSAAVVAHFEWLRDPSTQCGCVEEVSGIVSVEAPDASTVVFTLTASDPFFLSFLASSSGFVASPKAVAAAHPDYGVYYGAEPVGTGPFSLESSVPFVLRKNPDYWRTDDEGRSLPYLDEIEVRTIPDDADRLAALRSGEIDLMQTSDNATVTAAAEDGLGVQKVAGSTARMLIFNTRKAPFDDVRLRRAVAQGIDRQALDDAAYGETHLETDTPFPYGSQLDPGVEWPAFDADAAKDLLADLEASGPVDTITHTCIATAELRAVSAEIERQAEDIGLTVESEYQDGGEFVNTIFGGRDFEAACFTGPFMVDADGLYAFFHTSGRGNPSGYSNPEVDRTLEEIRTTGDAAEQQRLLEVVAKQLAEDVPAIPLYFELHANIYSDHVSGLPEPESAWLGVIRFTTLYRTT